MAKPHVEHENERLTVKDVGLKVDDIQADNPDVEKVVLKIANEDKNITYKPRKEVQKQVTRNGAKMFTPTKVPKTRGELYEGLEELIQINAEQDSFKVNISYHEWNQAADPEEDGEETYFYMQERHLDDLRVVISEDSEEETGGNDKVEVEFSGEVPKFMGTDLEEYGPFEEGDTAEVPEDNAEILVEKDKAERL